jgi:hypothetical protein
MINYVIAAWAGDRRVNDLVYKSDRTCYLKSHLQQLEKLKHNLDQITIVVASAVEDRPEFAEYIDSIRDKYTIIERENYGQSYGSWCKAYEIYRDKFDYYVFVEDDYVFMLDDFDSLLVEDFKSRENCGYLCSKVGKSKDGIEHASISNGICSSEALGKVWDKFGWLPHPMDNIYSTDPQICFSLAFADVGYRLQDFSESYFLPYTNPVYLNTCGDLEIISLGNTDKPPIIVPVQYLDSINKKAQIND